MSVRPSVVLNVKHQKEPQAKIMRLSEAAPKKTISQNSWREILCICLSVPPPIGCEGAGRSSENLGGSWNEPSSILSTYSFSRCP